MVALQDIMSQLDSLSAESLTALASYAEYLRWKEGSVSTSGAGRPWGFDFVEHFRQATVSADKDPAGIDVRIDEAACHGVIRMALLQHPPLAGAALVDYQVPVPAGVRNLRLQFATGIRDGADLAPGNVVAFRVFVNDWQIWSDTQSTRHWVERKIVMPAVGGDMARVRFVTDGLGNHEWAWAAWATPRLHGEVANA